MEQSHLYSKLIPFVEENQDKIDWKNLSRNVDAISLLEQNQDKIDWRWLSRNPNYVYS
jgi:hypothetical protein